jgi:hypothetical protein
MIYETKGLSLEEVDELYERVQKAWKSQGFVPQVRFQELDTTRRKSLTEFVEERRRSVEGTENVGGGKV